MVDWGSVVDGCSVVNRGGMVGGGGDGGVLGLTGVGDLSDVTLLGKRGGLMGGWNWWKTDRWWAGLREGIRNV